jgi:hypothetical protein
VVQVVEMGAKARAGRPWDAVVQAVEVLCAGGARDRTVHEVPTVADFCDEWTSGRLHARFPDDVAKKKPSSVTSDEGIAEKYVKPHLEGVRVGEVTLAHCELVMANVPAELSPSSRRQVAQVLCKLLAFAVYPCRYLGASPVPRGWLPKIGKAKAMQGVRPGEDARHLSNATLPLWRRLFFGIDRREGSESRSWRRCTRTGSPPSSEPTSRRPASRAPSCTRTARTGESSGRTTPARPSSPRHWPAASQRRV